MARGLQSASLWVPFWALRNRSTAAILQSTAYNAERRDDGGLLRITGELAWNGELPSDLLLGLREQGVPHDFVIQDTFGIGPDRRGYWRPGMDVPRTWFALDDSGLRSRVSEVLSVRVSCHSPPVAESNEADTFLVPDLLAFPDPRAAHAERLRLELQGRSTRPSYRRRPKL